MPRKAETEREIEGKNKNKDPGVRNYPGFFVSDKNLDEFCQGVRNKIITHSLLSGTIIEFFKSY
jgi:hypothetical protein